MPTTSIQAAITSFLDMVRLSRSKNTHDTYAFAMKAFQDLLQSKGLHLEAPVTSLSEDNISWYADYLKHQSPATEQLYLQAAKNFYKYLAAEKLADINLPRLDLLKQQRARRPGIRLPQFPAEDIERVLRHVGEENFAVRPSELDQLRALRERAFLL